MKAFSFLSPFTGPENQKFDNTNRLARVRYRFKLYGKQSATSGKAGGLKKVEPLKADRSCEPLKAVRL